jgi:hypothetical protein
VRTLTLPTLLLLLLGSREAAAQTAAESPWSFSAFAYTYIVPEDSNYVQPTVTADRKRLHLEARFNYEDRNTGSVWAGFNFSGGDAVSWELTPMLGGIFGQTSGLAPGYKGWIAWRALEFYSEGEAVFDAVSTEDNFLYNWSELTLSPVDWLRFGLVTQRTRAYQSDREIQRGLLVGASYRALEMTAYVFNPDDSKPIVVIAFGVSF